MNVLRLILLPAAVLACPSCQTDPYRYTEPFAGIERQTLTPDSLVTALGPPARINHSSSSAHKEGPPADTAYRYYFATRDGYPGSKGFYFDQGRWTGESVLGGTRRQDLFRLLDPQVPSDRQLIERWDLENPNVW